jgi:hypothetical protein
MKPRNIFKVRTILSLILLGSSLTLGGNAYAAKGAGGGGGGGGVPIPVGGGGTVKPPAKNLVAPVFVPSLANPTPFGTNITGFDATGIVQDAKVDHDNLDGHVDGCSGSATIDSKSIIIPCGLIVQMPANTLTWAAYAEPDPSGVVKGLEISVVGNVVNGRYIAALAFISQQSLHGGSGKITDIDYDKGEIVIDGVTTLQINDPNGRFGRAQSPDPRFSVDDQNATIHAATGYPMCVPRNKDALGIDYLTDTIAGIAHPRDPLCPQKNRPLAAGGCRNFGQSGFAPPVSGELNVPVFGQTYCSQYVMPAVDGAKEYPSNVALTQTNAAPFNPKVMIPGTNDPDPRQQAPFEIGDYLAYSGTLLSNGTVSAHTIEANVGIFTQPGTQPSYMAIGEFGVGTADPTPASVNGIAQESTNRIFLEAAVTDYRTPIDVYYIDETNGGVIATGFGVPPGGIVNRWVTPWEMTGECPPANGLPAANGGNAPLAAACNGVTGGISTSLTGPQVQRDRIRAVKAPTGLLNQPSRTVRVMARSLCTPTAAVNGGPGLVDACIATASLPANKVANGLIAGQYLAPVFEYIFPENVKPGDPLIPFDIWHLPFLRNGETNGTPALNPLPW